MGVERFAAEFLCWCRATGADFSDTLTLGRQDFDVIGRDLLAVGLPETLHSVRTAEPFLGALGAARVTSVDNSRFEGASVIHDLNRPMPDDLARRFSVVFDGGTLEHVFDFPRALENVLGSVAVGGHFVTICPVNGFAGHGFYQFSPELWFRAMDAHGFVVERALLREMRGRRTQWWEVRDPGVVGSRPMFTSRHPVQLFLLARHPGSLGEGADAPMQSDYAAAWSAESPPVFDTGPRPWSRKLAGHRAGQVMSRFGRRFRPTWFIWPRFQRLTAHFSPAGTRLPLGFPH